MAEGGRGGRKGGAVAKWVRAFDRRPDGRGLESHCEKLFQTFRFGTLAISFTPLCQCLSETVKAVAVGSPLGLALPLLLVLSGRL